MDNFPLDHRQIQLDSEAIQRLMLAQSAETSAPTSVATSQGDGNPTRAKSPLSQAMLQIHSPNSMADLNMGDTVVLQMEEGKATLTAHPNGSVVKSERDSAVAVSASKAVTGAEVDEVFEKGKDKSKADTPAKQTLQAVLSSLITTHSHPNKEQEVTAKVKMEPIMSTSASKPGNHGKKGSPKSSASESSSTILVSPNVGLNIPVMGMNSANGRKCSLGDITVPRPSNGSSPSLASPGAVVVQPQVSERKRSKVKAPHPAFNIQAGTVDKLGGVYNYNLPDRGLGSLINSPPVAPVSLSPPSVSVPRFPVSVPAVVSPQVLNFVTPVWPMTRPLNQSPASSDSRNSGSPLDLSNVREPSPNLAKVQSEHKTALMVEKLASVSNLPKQQVVAENGANKVSVHSTKGANDDSSKKQGSGKQSASQSPSLPASSKPPYVQEMLYLFDREFEIVSVGKNKWIVRNESDLINTIKRNGSLKENQSGSCHKCATGQVLNGADSMMHGDSSGNGDMNKRPNGSENEGQRAKVMKLTNGDVHAEVNGQSASAEMVSSPVTVAMETKTNQSVNTQAIETQEGK